MRGSSRVFVVRASRVMCHPHVFVLTLSDYSTFLSLLSIFSYHPVFLPAHQFHLPGCGGHSLCTLANEDLGTLAEYDPLTLC